jgi:hypothetical protein
MVESKGIGRYSRGLLEIKCRHSLGGSEEISQKKKRPC